MKFKNFFKKDNSATSIKVDEVIGKIQEELKIIMESNIVHENNKLLLRPYLLPEEKYAFGWTIYTGETDGAIKITDLVGQPIICDKKLISLVMKKLERAKKFPETETQTREKINE